MKKASIYGMMGIFMACVLLTSCRKPDSVNEDIPYSQEEGSSTGNETGMEEAAKEDVQDMESGRYRLPEAQRPSVKILENLGMPSEFLSGKFYRSGDMNTSFYVNVGETEAGDPLLSDTLEMAFWTENLLNETEDGFASIEIQSEKGKSIYDADMEIEISHNGMLVRTDQEKVKVSFLREDVGGAKVVVDGNGAFSGTYYPEHEYDGFWVSERYCFPAELSYLPTEDLRLLRNGIYARHGRKFDDPVLKEYFEKKFWYHGWAEPEDFSDRVLSEVEKSNIKLLHELEKEPFDSRNGTEYKGPDGMESAPYMEYLDLNRETGIYVNLDEAEDAGAFWRVPGMISLPVTMTRSQWENVHSGGEAEVAADELTGEVLKVKYDEKTGYTLYEDGKNPQESELFFEVGCWYNYETGYYQFWHMSDDTIMKPVYQGEILIAKGAVWGANVSLLHSSMDQTEFRIEKNSAGENVVESGLYYGNSIVHDGRGHILAMYSLGD